MIIQILKHLKKIPSLPTHVQHPLVKFDQTHILLSVASPGNLFPSNLSLHYNLHT
jgi:uncharacterized protein YdgA (DUF945 family)